MLVENQSNVDRANAWSADYLSRLASVRSTDDWFQLLLGKVQEFDFHWVSFSLLSADTGIEISCHTNLDDSNLMSASLSKNPASYPNSWQVMTLSGPYTGWTFLSNHPDGMLGTLSVATDRQDPKTNVAETHKDRLAWLCDIALASLLRHVDRPEEALARPKLSANEIEVLRWICDGKDVREISRITALPERNINFHIVNAQAKMRCTNPLQAAFKAVAWGLI